MILECVRFVRKLSGYGVSRIGVGTGNGVGAGAVTGEQSVEGYAVLIIVGEQASFTGVNPTALY